MAKASEDKAKTSFTIPKKQSGYDGKDPHHEATE